MARLFPLTNSSVEFFPGKVKWIISWKTLQAFVLYGKNIGYGKSLTLRMVSISPWETPGMKILSKANWGSFPSIFVFGLLGPVDLNQAMP